VGQGRRERAQAGGRVAVAVVDRPTVGIGTARVPPEAEDGVLVAGGPPVALGPVAAPHDGEPSRPRGPARGRRGRARCHRCHRCHRCRGCRRGARRPAGACDAQPQGHPRLPAVVAGQGQPDLVAARRAEGVADQGRGARTRDVPPRVVEVPAVAPHPRAGRQRRSDRRRRAGSGRTDHMQPGGRRRRRTRRPRHGSRGARQRLFGVGGRGGAEQKRCGERCPGELPGARPSFAGPLLLHEVLLTRCRGW